MEAAWAGAAGAKEGAAWGWAVAAREALDAVAAVREAWGWGWVGEGLAGEAIPVLVLAREAAPAR